MEIGESVVQSVILHQVGNRLREEALVLSDQCFAINENLSNAILGGYLRGIVSSKYQYLLTHESDIALNDVAHHISDFFSKDTSFVELSKSLAIHLYNSAHHPNIAAGDLFVILFDCLKLDGEYRSAIGVYKSESKQQYLLTRSDGKTQQLEVSIGINPEQIDKGALIIEGSEIIYAVDRLSNRTKYWVDDFLNAKQVPNENTKSALATDIIEKVRESIESPVEQQKYCREVIALCSDRDKVIGDDIKNISEKYVPADLWLQQLDILVKRKGLTDSNDIAISTKTLQTKMRKVLSRINLDHGIAMLVPDELSLAGVNYRSDAKKLDLMVTLEKKNG